MPYRGPLSGPGRIRPARCALQESCRIVFEIVFAYPARPVVSGLAATHWRLLRRPLTRNRLRLAQPQHPPDLLLVGTGGDEILERLLGYTNEVAPDELGSLARAVLGMLEAAFPFEHRPAVVAILSHLREDGTKIHLSVTERAEPAGAGHPGLKTRIDALPTGRIKLGIFHMEGLDPLVINVNERQVIEVLQYEVRRVIVDASTLVVPHGGEEHLKSGAVKHVFAGMDLVADIAIDVLIGVEDRLPTPRELRKGPFDEAGHARRPRISERPGQRPREADGGIEPKMLRSLGGHVQLLDGPCLPLLRLAVN